MTILSFGTLQKLGDDACASNYDLFCVAVYVFYIICGCSKNKFIKPAGHVEFPILRFAVNAWFMQIRSRIVTSQVQRNKQYKVGRSFTWLPQVGSCSPGVGL